MNALFPIIQPAASAGADTSPGLYREVKWDFDRNVPLFKNGSPVVAEGREAVLTWAWKALHTPRFRHEIYTRDYGNEAEALIGRPFTEALKQSEAARCVRECLLINPYITGVTGVSVTFSDGSLRIGCSIQTVYGEVKV